MEEEGSVVAVLRCLVLQSGILWFLSLWKGMKGGYAVFSGQYSTEHDSKITHDIGDFTISTREATISKAVKSAGDWFIAWNQAVAATVFVFPH